MIQQTTQVHQDQSALLKWYAENKRVLPWRDCGDPYKIWLSEVMLQQTTVSAVKPYFERFIKRFPTVESLAKGPLDDVLEHWAGLGYYSRARRLYECAQVFAQKGFPKTHQELIKMPGFGPYTSRAVSSLAFAENVGLVDGNVIRVLSRKYGVENDWWTPKGRQLLQELSDNLVKGASSSDVNQALMDLGSMVCVPQTPKCFLCPWLKTCHAYQENKIEMLPRPKPRRDREVWVWKVSVMLKKNKLAFVKNDYAPFLKNQLIWPGQIKQKKSAPKAYHLRHSITHHDIYIQIQKNSDVDSNKKLYWYTSKEIKSINPSSLIQKTIATFLKMN